MNRKKVVYEHVHRCQEQDEEMIKKADKLYDEFKEVIMNSNITDVKKAKLIKEFDDFICLNFNLAFKREEAVKERWKTYNDYIEAVKEIKRLKESK